jgi:hypothetical protein
MFKKLVDELLTQIENNNIIIDNLEKDYINNTKLSVFVCEEFLDKINIFENFLQSINLQDLIYDLIEAKSNCSDCSFEELVVNDNTVDSNKDVNKDEDEDEDKDEDDDDDDGSDVSIFSNSEEEDDNIEYILKVDIDNHDIKLVNKVSDTFKNEYIDGIIYISIKNKDYHIFSAHTNE